MELRLLCCQLLSLSLHASYTIVSREMVPDRKMQDLGVGMWVMHKGEDLILNL